MRVCTLRDERRIKFAAINARLRSKHEQEATLGVKIHMEREERECGAKPPLATMACSIGFVCPYTMQPVL
jgi:hypothetical protein